MADFKIAFANGSTADYSGQYQIDGATGVLTVFQDSATKLTFSPCGWLCIEEQVPPSVYETQGLTTV